MSLKGQLRFIDRGLLLAVVCLDYFFTAPLFTLGMNDLQSYVAMILLTTSLIITVSVQGAQAGEEALSSVSYKVIKAEEQERHRMAQNFTKTLVNG